MKVRRYQVDHNFQRRVDQFYDQNQGYSKSESDEIEGGDTVEERQQQNRRGRQEVGPHVPLGIYRPENSFNGAVDQLYKA
jgi:hypothetical protein